MDNERDRGRIEAQEIQDQLDERYGKTGPLMVYLTCGPCGEMLKAGDRYKPDRPGDHLVVRCPRCHRGGAINGLAILP